MEEKAVRAVNALALKWMNEAATNIKQHMNEQLNIQTKSGRTDLVTNLDKETERFLVSQIQATFPTDQIISEEGFGDQVTSMTGRVWFVDPIDGTINFVKQRDNFAMMLALYEDGKPVYGNILAVMANRFIFGGPQMGVYLNEHLLAAPGAQPLAKGLFGVNGPMFAKNIDHVQEIGLASSGTRILGSAGIEFQQVLLGNEVGYISHLAPWDMAAGRVLAESLNLLVTRIDGSPVDMLKSGTVLVTNKNALQTIEEFQNN
ncbi:inositol monophosphatase family protein [Loigolactobacillus iwatensis]|uniref:inositol monophosphatase family protein n=1 Tax=Loigolactobacillus iwatensis TaxID=1267156 RepID=UPI000F7EBAD1|nr:inositol monophosphatase family protein [Loigolactobacillus iwatensis]